MAWEMSPMRAPGRAAAIPARSARSVASISATLSAGLRSPTRKLIGGVRDDSAQGDGEVEREQVAVGERVVVRQPVQHGVVDRRADVVAERPAPEGRRVVDVAGLARRPRRSSPGPTGRCPAGWCRPRSGPSASAGCRRPARRPPSPAAARRGSGSRSCGAFLARPITIPVILSRY